MRPVPTASSNALLHGPQDIDDLPCERTTVPGPDGGVRKVVRSIWIPSAEELAFIRNGGVLRIQVDVHADPPPPISVEMSLTRLERDRDLSHRTGCLRCLARRFEESGHGQPSASRGSRPSKQVVR